MTPTDHGAIDLVPYKEAIKRRERIDFVGVEFTITAAKEIVAAIEALRERVAELKPNKRAPVQGYSAGISWSMHLRAYDVYCKKYSSQPALIDLEKKNCRGGFGTEELDEFIPGWREELSETAQLLQRAEAAEARVAELMEVAVVLDVIFKQSSAGLAALARDGLREVKALAESDTLATTPAEALERGRVVESIVEAARALIKEGMTGGNPDMNQIVRQYLGKALAKLDDLAKE